MKIYLKEYNREHPDFVAAFQPNGDGEVSIEVLKKLWQLEAVEQIKKALTNHPDFYVVESAPKNGDTSTKKNSELPDK